ncbi:lysine/ornithine N-monooxygenase [Catellatospora sp. TT07R-123]|uniref:lysine N(6)-hydroxylase/L-ornithine N(5)-oxygenase family protein n=1 Tax=Catellatospora sp. TT07R-123 TaxID=2733863 RepID=UPI001B06AF26|nr:lysine N(6)-hydroxylase/L-ornithine N(5)-oxygenase family protein [Catellatospora sp. TT07R-123]GHJ44007.1 lysine/ornithine N-monooxygenase [Catellatospora sp. TT07R-123]
MFTSADEVHDLVGVGFGPSNLALAIALRERGEHGSAVFFERQPAFAWHPGLLIEGTTMQVSFLKDLATMRNPSSAFSFLNYLQDKGRLADFINHKTMFPSRVEFHDYLEWAARRFTDQVHYASEVLAVTPVRAGGTVTACDVEVRQHVRGGTPVVRRVRTRNLVVATGLQPRLPETVTSGPRIWHSSEYLHRVDRLRDPRRIVVVGAGQSAAEVTDHLHRTFPGAEICALFSKYGYTPADDTPFANRIFDPAAVDDYYGAPDQVKELLHGYHAGTNYSVVDTELIVELYRRAYQEKIHHTERLRIMNVSRLVTATGDHDGVTAVIEHLPTGARTELAADAIICATGYHSGDPRRLLGELADECLTRPDGRLRIERDYRVATTGALACGIYVQGATEHTHGLSSTLLSNVAVRAGEIAQSIAARPAHRLVAAAA